MDQRMRSVRTMLPMLFLALSVGCSASPSSSPQSTVLPTVTPFVNDQPTPTLNPTSTITAGATALTTVVPEIAAARTALEKGAFEEAIGYVAPIAATNTEAAEIEVEARLAWAQAIIQAAKGDLEQLRMAHDQLNSAVRIVSSSSAIQAQAKAWQFATERFISLRLGMNQLQALRTASAPLAEQQGTAEQLITATVGLGADTVAFPGLMELGTAALVAAARVPEDRAATLNARSEKMPLWTEAQNLCQRAVDLWPPGAAQASEAKKCVTRLASMINPPPPVTEPAPPPTPQKILRVSLLNYDDTPTCISFRISGTNTAGWSLSVDGLNLRASFQGGDARTCGLGNQQEVTISISNAQGRVVLGGQGVKAKGSAILLGVWR